MTVSISIAKPGLKTSLIEALYNEILTNSNSYYYFLGRTLPYGNGDTVETPDITAAYEANTRDQIIFMNPQSATELTLDCIVYQVDDQGFPKINENHRRSISAYLKKMSAERGITAPGESAPAPAVTRRPTPGRPARCAGSGRPRAA